MLSMCPHSLCCGQARYHSEEVVMDSMEEDLALAFAEGEEYMGVVEEVEGSGKEYGGLYSKSAERG